MSQAGRQIKGPLTCRAFQADAHLRIAEFLVAAKRRFDAPANIAPRALQLARHGGLVFPEQAPNFGKRSVVHVVIREAQAVAWIESIQRDCERDLQYRKIARALRIRRNTCSSHRRKRRNFGAWLALIIIERFCSSSATNLVHVPPRENSAQPGAKLAAAVKIIEERLPLSPALAQAVQIGAEGIGEVASCGFTTARISHDGSRRTVKFRPVLRHEEIPCRVVPGAARTRQSKIAKI